MSTAPTITLAESVEREAARYRAFRSPVGDLIAQDLERLAQLVRWTGATTAEEHLARMDVWDAEIRQQHFDRGHAEGLEAGRREGRDLAFREIGLVLRRSVGAR